MNEPKHKTGPKMKAVTESPTEEKTAPSMPEAPKNYGIEAETGLFEARNSEIPWKSMDSAPKDGKPLWLRIGDRAIEAQWHRTRHFEGGVWRDTGFWRMLFGPHAPLAEKPSGWWRENDHAA